MKISIKHAKNQIKELIKENRPMSGSVVKILLEEVGYHYGEKTKQKLKKQLKL